MSDVIKLFDDEVIDNIILFDYSCSCSEYSVENTHKHYHNVHGSPLQINNFNRREVTPEIAAQSANNKRGKAHNELQRAYYAGLYTTGQGPEITSEPNTLPEGQHYGYVKGAYQNQVIEQSNEGTNSSLQPARPIPKLVDPLRRVEFVSQQIGKPPKPRRVTRRLPPAGPVEQV
jgi:hypothetical protein